VILYLKMVLMYLKINVNLHNESNNEMIKE